MSAPQRERHPHPLALIDLLFAEAPIGLGVWDRDLRYLLVNRRLAEINGVPVEQHIGRTIPEVLPDLDPQVERAFRRVVETGEAIVDQEVTGETPAAPGELRTWLMSLYPLHDPAGAPVGVGCAIVKVSDQRAAEAERTRLLAQLANERARLEEVVRRMPAGVVIAEAPTGRLVMGNERFEAIFRRPFSPTPGVEGYDEWRGFHPGGGPRLRPREWPIARSLASGEVVVDREIEIERGDGTRGTISISSAPVHDARGEIVAAVATVLDITDRRRAEQERARLLELEQQARLRAELAERRASFLAETGTLLSASLDYETTLANVSRAAVPALADWAVIDLVQATTVQRVASAHVDPDKAELPLELARRYPIDLEGETPAAQVLRGGDAVLLREIPPELIEATARDEEHKRILLEAGIVSAMIVPLRARGRTFGAMTLASSTPGRLFGDEDLELAEEVARRCATAVDNARLYRERTYVAQTLQRSLLPDRVPEIPGVELAVRFRAAGEGNEVGGDFYDMFEARDGSWWIVIGDVSGKGAAAAALTALARYTVRAAAEIERTPTAVLQFLNEAMLRHGSEDRFATVLLGQLEADDGGITVCLATGGHPLPVVVRAGGALEQVGRPGTLMGIVRDPRLNEAAVRLEPGDKLVLYTDGVTEARVPGGMLGASGLLELLSGAGERDASETAERIEQAAIEHAPDGPRDDIAVVVVQASTAGARPGLEGAVQATAESAGEGLQLRLGGGAEAPARAREALAALTDRMDADALWNARLLVTELVTNSVRHGGAQAEDAFIGLEVELLTDAVRIAVHDRGPGFEAVARPPDVASPSGRGLFLVEQFADRWGTSDGGTRVWFELDRGERGAG